MTYTRTYSDGSKIELGSEPGKGWIAVLKASHEATIPEAEVDALLSGMDRMMAREAEYQAALASAQTPFEAYWAGSASASVMRDYRAGRTRRITGKQAHLVDDVKRPG
ncbi:UNVERIFIED_ORG: hypothetical protein ABID33_000220 [Xanthobacter viscosus]|uniref:Uncharacterized protein n=1 Tax=Xanthobacter autotrophicus TaxID=280 RepID=A0A6C1KLE0_XANAU|nr:hypothetical protein [Xanthobacter autotrophicus]TLX43884.1 hypothetical protein FBQ73_07230 [Xanthobacter autotrophicus]